MFAFFSIMSFFMIFIPEAILAKMASGIKIIKKDMMLKKANINPNEYLISLVIVSPF